MTGSSRNSIPAQDRESTFSPKETAMSQSSILCPPSRSNPRLPEALPFIEGQGSMNEIPLPASEHISAFHIEENLLSAVPLPLSLSLKKFLGQILGLHKICSLYDPLKAPLSPEDLAQSILNSLKIRMQIHGLDSIPQEGPLLLVSNHPFGLLEGLVLIAAFTPLRPDLRIIANSILSQIDPLASSFIGVDPFGGETAPRRNLAGLRKSLHHLEQGKALAIFPAGEVSHWQAGCGITDPQWNDAAVRLALRSGASVVPLYFSGRNSLHFSLAGLIHPLCRTMLLPREFLARRGKEVHVHVGNPIRALTALPDPHTATDYIRLRCYELADSPRKTAVSRELQPLAPPTPKELLEEEIAGLPSSALLVQEGDYRVFLRRGAESPMLFRELGRIREEVFRNEGEGTGLALDLDSYDRHYWHLLLWNDRTREIAGAYRLGLVSEILHSKGVKGLYCHTLFRFSPAFFTRYSQSIELGRALVHPRYQRDFLPLLLLWKGISRFVLRNPSIRTLFGPASLNLTTSRAGLALVTSYLLSRHGFPGAGVSGRRPPHNLRLNERTGGLALNRAIRCGEIDYRQLDTLVRDLNNGRGIPILFKHYLKLGGRIAAFHQDDAFNTLDGLLLVDLPKAPLPLLARYMGAEQARNYVRSHAKVETGLATERKPRV